MGSDEQVRRDDYIDGILHAVRQPSAHFILHKDGTVEQAVESEEVSWGPIIHKEPECRGYNRCRYMEPHEHGFACDKTCIECWGVCHSDCPANDADKNDKRQEGES